MNATECPVCQPILDDILLAKSFGDLVTIQKRRIPSAIGISNEQQAELLKAVVDREEELLRMAGF